MKVLITDISSPKAVSIAKFIKRRYPGAEVVTCDTRRIAARLHTRYSDRHHLIPAKLADADGYCRGLLAVIEAERPDVCIPVNNREMKALMERRERLPQALAWLGSRESFEKLDNKANLQAVAAELGLTSPRAYRSLEEAAVPFVVKPEALTSSSGVKYVFTEAQKRALPPLGPGFVCQQYIEGFGAGYSAFCVNGEIACGFAHRRLLEYPCSGGTSVYRENYANDGMSETARKLLRITRWSGFVMLEFKVDKDGRAWLIEANPRIWGSINQGLANGANYFERLLGPAAAGPERPEGVRTYFSPLVYGTMPGYLLRLRAGAVAAFFRNLASNRSDVSLLDDPRGWLGWLSIAYEKN